MAALPLLCMYVYLQGQASDILIQAKEIERLRDLLISLYVKHCGQETDAVGEYAWADGCWAVGPSSGKLSPAVGTH